MAREVKRSDFPKPRPTNLLNRELERSLSAYAVAAAAAGVSLLAFPQSTEAKIVYTKTDIDIPVNGGFVPIDLNRDGHADFSFSNWNYNWSEHGSVASLLQVVPKRPGNAVRGRGNFGFSFQGFSGLFASALHRSFAVGPDKTYFQKSKGWLMGF
jgi:hypothetical protein